MARAKAKQAKAQQAKAQRAKSQRMSRGEARRAVMLAAATSVFLKRGFEGATLDEVISRSGGSRATLYEKFGGKEGLFAAIIDDLCRTLVAPLAAGPDGDPAPKAVLTAFARRFLDRLLEPESIGLYRLVISEVHRFPALGGQVFAAGPTAAAETLAKYLRAETARGRLRVRQPEVAARLFLEMIKGDLHTRALFGVGPVPSAAEINACVNEAVRIFLDGHAP